MQNPDFQEILNNNPFEIEAPSTYEQWLNAALTVAFNHIAGLSRDLALLAAKIDEHEKGHRAVNIAAMDLPQAEKTEKSN